MRLKKKKKNFFKSEEERNLWVKLNAEIARYLHETVNHAPKKDLGDVDTPYSYMWISNNQLTYDECEHEAPRFSFEELLLLDFDELIILKQKKDREFIEKTFPEYLKSNE